MTKGMGVVAEKKLEKQIEKQMGCMAGFLHIFDRHQIFAGKRIYSVKRLPPSTPPEAHSSPEPDTHGGSTADSTPETETETETPAQPPEKTPPPLPAFDFKEGTRSSWKFAREAPRLSLDSRAVVDAKGTIHRREEEEKRRRSTSVVAKLMGLEDSKSGPELRRSASESRVPNDLLSQQQQQQCYRFFDTTNFQLKQQHVENSAGFSDPNAKAEPVVRGIIRQRNKSFYDSTDIFPNKQSTVSSVHGEIERRLRMRGIDEPSKDLETLKQILEALQLKGLLHSKKSTPPIMNHRYRNVNDSPIVVMKPGRSPGSLNRTGWTGYDSPPASSFRSSPRARPEITDRNARAQPQQAPRASRNASSPTRSPNRVRKPTNIETQRKVNVDDGVVDRRRPISPVHSTKLNSRNGPERQVNSRSPRTRKTTTYQKEEKPMVEDESSTVSDSSFSTSSHTTDTERFKVEDQYREGKDLLRRCDKLLSSIAEITTGRTELQQPSPVSVLDSSFYKDESSCSPSPVMKRCIDDKDHGMESEDDAWIAALCCSSEAKSEDSDFAYVSEVLRASNYSHVGDSDVFLLLEQQQYLKGTDTSKVSTLQRRLIFDTIHEILKRHRRLPPWRAENAPPFHRIWSEFQRIRERSEESEDLFEVICGVLKKDMTEDANVNEWGECPIEMGDVVLDIERLIFKDLIGETIQDLASFKGQRINNKVSALRRKLVF